MKILYIHQHFKTPKEPGGTRSYWIAKQLLQEGHEVVMISGTTSSDQNVKVEMIDGIKVIYISVFYDQTLSFIGRLRSFVSFMTKASRQGFKVKDIDLVIATSTPLTIGFPALLLKWFKSIPFVFEVRDLWPEVPIQMGGLKNPILRGTAKWFEKTIYKNALHIIALSPGMADGVLKYEKRQKVSMIPNMAKIDKFWPREKNTSLIKELGLREDSFKIIHFGALGQANGANTILDSAALLKNDSSIDFIFVGGGATEKDLISRCEDEGIKNVHFLGRYSMDQTSEIVNFCSVSIVSFKDVPILYTNSPNKLFDSLSAGKPIIVNSNGWTRKMVEEAYCGFYVRPDKPIELVNRILQLQNDDSLTSTMGENSRKLAESTYDKGILCKQFSDVISNLQNKELI